MFQNSLLSKNYMRCTQHVPYCQKIGNNYRWGILRQQQILNNGFLHGKQKHKHLKCHCLFLKMSWFGSWICFLSWWSYQIIWKWLGVTYPTHAHINAILSLNWHKQSTIQIKSIGYSYSLMVWALCNKLSSFVAFNCCKQPLYHQ